MKFFFAIFFLIQISLQAIFPIIDHPSDIKDFFPKTENEVEQIKKEVLQEFNEKITFVLQNPTSSHEKIITYWDEAWGMIDVYSELLDTMSMVSLSRKIRGASSEAAKEIRQHAKQTLLHNPELYQIFQEILDERSSELSLRLKFYISELLKSFEALGLNLKPSDRKKFLKIQNELSDLCSIFRKNIIEDRSYILVKKENLEGMNENIIDSLEKDDKGNYKLYCDYPTVFPVLARCLNTSTRKKMANAFHNRAYPDNLPILEKIIEKRDALASLLGFGSYAQFQLNQMMIETPQNAEEFLYNLLKKIQEKEDREFLSLRRHLPESVELTDEGKIEAHDISFLWNSYLKKNLNLNSEYIAEFFPLEEVLNRSIGFFENFFHVHIIKTSLKDLWFPDLILLQVQKDDKNIGFIVLDLFPRAHKYSHACMCPLIPSWNAKNGISYPSLSVIIANFPKPSTHRPSLLSLENMRTLYHELGHAFHEILGRTDMILTCGTRVATDFVEMPSQLMEEWLFEGHILKEISYHYQTEKPLGDDLIEQIIEARRHDIATKIQRQIFLSFISLKYFQEGALKDTQNILKNFHELCRPNYSHDSSHHFQTSFGHLDGYGAAYYGYLFSKVIALDIFENFKNNNSFDEEKMKSYIQNILGKGGSEDPSILLENYLRRHPNLFSFLKRLRIDGMEDNNGNLPFSLYDLPISRRVLR